MQGEGRGKGCVTTRPYMLALFSLSFYTGFCNTKTNPTILPIRTIAFDDPADVARHDRMVALVEGMLELHQRLATAQLPQEKRLLQQQIEAVDKAIDALVYELYGLTAEEIAVVEGTG